MNEPRFPAPGHRVVVSELGETPADAVERFMTLEPMAAPDPATLAPNEVVVAIRSAAVGWVDLLMASGHYQHASAPPYTPGLEYAGDVVWVGAEVSRVQVGARVLNDGLLAGPRARGPYQRSGGFASYAVVPEAAAIPIPGALSYDAACNVLGNYETAYHCLIARGRLVAGETVLVLGASGATGLAAVHVAKRVGATVIAAGRSAEKLALVSAEGADHVVVTADGWSDEVKALGGGRGVDMVYDGVGGEASLEALRAVVFGARYLVVGWAATPFVAAGRGRGGAPHANQLPTNLILMKGLDVLGCPMVIATLADPSLRAPRLAAVLGWMASGAIVPRVAAAYPLSEFKAALGAKWASAGVGGIVVRP